MRILYITTEIPYPLTSGFLRHYHFLRGLGQRHALTYLSLTRKPSISPETTEALARYTERISIFGIPEASEPWVIKRAGQVPKIGRRTQRALRFRWAARQMKQAVQELVQQEPYDLVFFSGKDTYPAIEDLHELPIVIDCCDTTSLRVRGEMPYASLTRRLWLHIRYIEVRRIEKKLVRKTPHLAFASIRDQVAMLGSDDAGEIIPQAVDLEYWTRRSHKPRPNSIVFTGVMSYPPNHDAALFLIEKILPLVRQSIPNVEVFIVGRDPFPSLMEAARPYPYVTVTGEPEDMRTYFELATVCCAPMRFASGMQFKVLEALAMEVPMVTTPAAADGLRIDGEVPPLVVGEDKHELANGIINLLRRDNERARLAAEGRRFIETHFVWARSVEKLEKMWVDAAAQTGSGGLVSREYAPDISL
jgi:glycosyltransferase involved in cell wall biosynthesis